MNTNFVGWNNPIIHDDARKLYEELYGENGALYLDILESAPQENAVISMLIAYLLSNKEAS